MKKLFLFALSLAAGMTVAQAQTSPYVGATLAEGDFFLYNVETGKWLQENNSTPSDWNSHAELHPTVGFEWGIVSIEGGYRLDPHLSSGNNSMNSSNFYLDTGDGVTAWTFEPVAGSVSNAYAIKSGDVNLGVGTFGFLANVSTKNTWQLVSKAERRSVTLADMAKATLTNPVDITWMIPGADFNLFDTHADQFNKVFNGTTGAAFATGQFLGNGIREVWSNPDGFDINYTLTDIPNGIYRMEFSGYYRDGAVGDIGTKYANGTETLRAEYYANDVSGTVMSICTPGIKENTRGFTTKTGDYNVPNNASNAAETTRWGYYVHTPLLVVVKDGTLKVGVRKDGGVADDWTVLDYIHVSYLGPDTYGTAKTTSPYTGSEVGEGDFYLYNVATGLWIQNIDARNRRTTATVNWNTGAGMGTAGFNFTLTAVDGGYKLDPHENPRNFGWGYGDGDIMYLDGNIGGNTHWDFTPVEVAGVSNTYKISIDGHVMGTEYGKDRVYLINNATTNDVWQLVTKAERLEKMQDLASEDNPYDVSFLLGDWNFATNNLRREEQWVENQNGGNNDGYPRALSWNSSHLVWNTNSYSYTQELTGLPDGIYKFTVQGMYRDGNIGDVGDKYANGTQNQIGKYFLGSEEQSLMSILDDARSIPLADDTWITAIANTGKGLYAPDNATNWSRLWAKNPEAYWNDPIVATIVGGTVNLGVRKTDLIGGDWLAMNEFKLEFLSGIDISEYTDALNAAIAAAEAFTGNTSTVLATALVTALSEAQAVTSSRDTDVLAAKTAALTAALAAAQNVDVTTLQTTVDQAVAEGLVGTELNTEFVANNTLTDAQNVLATATTSEQVASALDDLRRARRVFHAERHFIAFQGHEPAEGDFYLYNVGQGQFLCGGSDWGAHAALGWPGIEVTLIASGDGYVIDTHLNNGGSLQYLGNAGYCDSGENTSAWVFNDKSADGVKKYNMLRPEDHNRCMGFNPNFQWTRKDFDNLGTSMYNFDDPNNQWILVTKAERDALLTNATEAAPVDASHLIKMPGFNQREYVVSGTDNWNNVANGGVWTTTNFSIWERGGNYQNFVAEAYNTTDCHLTQTIEGLPAGLYEMEVQGYYRDGGRDQQASVIAGGGEAVQLATFYAGSESVLLPNITAEVGQAPGLGTLTSAGEYPDNCTQAGNYFTLGLYKTTLRVEVGTNGILTFGVKKDNRNYGGDWVVVDNFRLRMLTPYATATAKVTSAQYGTFIAPFAVEVPAGVTASTATIAANGTTLTLTDVGTTIPAHTPVVLYSETPVEETFCAAPTALPENLTAGVLTGVYEETTAPVGSYVLQNHDDVVAFYLVGGTRPTVKANRAYLVAPTGDVKAYFFGGEDAIGNLQDNGDANGIVYDLAGRRVSRPAKGLYIQNGHKVLK